MSELNRIDLKNCLVNAIADVFDTMLSMKVEAGESNPEEITNSRIVGTVGFAGKVMGCVNLHVGDAFAENITAAMLGMEPDEIETDEEIYDVIGELSNMVGGDLKSRLCDAGFECQLSIPSTTSGSNFKIESKGWMEQERIGFASGNDKGVAEVFIKAGD
ncbi:MAG: chemotaxis protein CheX [Desulfosarcina sp.]|nr:chemotaxis protein CheX [Desulfobacterales bacterium]